MKQLLFLRVYKGTDLVLVKQVEEPPVVLGRGGEVTIRLDGEGVSPIHSMIEDRDGKYFLCDLGSESGTFKNGESILDDEIKSGDEIKIGPFRLEFFIGLPKPKAPPPTEAKPKIEPKVEPKVEVKPEVKSEPLPLAPKPTPPQKPKDNDVAFARTTNELPKAPTTLAAVTPKKTEPKPKPKSPVTSGGGGGLETAPAGKTITPVRPATQTFAPLSEVKDLSKIIKPGKGSVVEVAVVWGDRIINTYHYDEAGVVNIGSHPDNEIVLPVFGSPHIKHPLLKIDSFATIFVSDSMTGDHFFENTRTPLRDYIREKRLTTIGGGFAIPLQQGEMVRIDFGRGLSVFVRYTAETAKPLPPPFFQLTTGEFTAIISTLVVGAVMALYMAVYQPDKKEPDKQDEPARKATFLYKKEKVQIDMNDMAGLPELPKDKKSEDALKGGASEAAPNNSKSKEKKLTAKKAGPDKGITKGAGVKAPTKPETKVAVAPAPPKPKDVTHEGLLSVFGKSGTQSALKKSGESAGALAGAANEATGTAAQGAGNAPGLGMKDIGAGGKGTATVGISGVKTKGKGGGLTGYGTGTLGDKDRASVELGGGAGESFTGNIDKEGIRRVILSNARQIQDCYNRGLNKDPSLHGKVVLKWEIADKGKVLSASVKSSTLENSVVEQCIVNRLKTWTFPEPPNNQIAEVAYPFVFLMQQ